MNAKGIKGVSCPSKYYGVAAVGKPVIGVLESGSEVRCIIENTNSGLCSEPGDYELVEQNINWFLENAGTDKVMEMGNRGRTYILDYLTRDISIAKYTKEILSL